MRNDAITPESAAQYAVAYDLPRETLTSAEAQAVYDKLKHEQGARASSVDAARQQPQSTPLPRADADRAAIASLILAFLFPPLGVVFGIVSRNQAHRKNMQPSAVATTGVVLSALFMVAAVIIAIAIATSQPDATQQWIDCINRQISDPNLVCPSP